MTFRLAAMTLVGASLLLLGAASVTEIQSMLAKSDVLCGRFDQSKQLVGLKKPLTSNGRFCVVADKGALWRILQPFPNTLRVTRDAIVQLRGERVAMRLNAAKEPNVQMITSLLFALLAGDIRQLENSFIAQTAVTDSSWSVKLKAREPALARLIGGIVLDGDTFVRKVTINESSGDRTEIVFSAIRTGDGAMSREEAALF
jgi:hypothetical protein